MEKTFAFRILYANDYTIAVSFQWLFIYYLNSSLELLQKFYALIKYDIF